MEKIISTKKFLEPHNLGEFKCPICFDVHLNNLMAIKDCGHLFGKNCLHNAMVAQLEIMMDEEDGEEDFEPKCPICKAIFDKNHDIQPASPALMRHLKNMKVKCGLDDCSWQNDAGDYHDHLKTCDFETILCPRAKCVCPNGHECVETDINDLDENYCNLCANEKESLQFCATCTWAMCDECSPARCSENIKRKDLEIHVLKHERNELRNMMTVVKECNKRKREDEKESSRKKIKLLADVRALLFENDPDNASLVGCFRLIEAIKSGVSQNVLEHVQTSDYINLSIGRQNITPLMMAIKENNIEIVELLIDNQADVNLGNHMCPLYLAITKNLKTIAVTLIHNDADVDQLSLGNSCLHLAVEEKMTEIVQELCNVNVNFNQINPTGHTPLSLGFATYMDYDTIQILLESSADPNIRLKEEDLPIVQLLSGFEGSYTRHRLLILLLKRGTKVPEKKQVKVFEKILQPNPKSLYWMILQEDWTSIDALLNKEGRAPHLFMPISSGDFENETPLMLCVWKQEEVLVKLILTARECCINALNDRGQTALGISARLGNLKISEMLIYHGADIPLSLNNFDEFPNIPAEIYLENQYLSLEQLEEIEQLNDPLELLEIDGLQDMVNRDPSEIPKKRPLTCIFDQKKRKHYAMSTKILEQICAFFDVTTGWLLFLLAKGYVPNEENSPSGKRPYVGWSTNDIGHPIFVTEAFNITNPPGESTSSEDEILDVGNILATLWKKIQKYCPESYLNIFTSTGEKWRKEVREMIIASEVKKSKSLGYIQTLTQDFSELGPESVEEMIDCLADEAEFDEVDLEAILKANLEELELVFDDEDESVL